MHQPDEQKLDEDGSTAVNRQFGELMKECRESKGLSQRQLAEMLHHVNLKLDPSAITRIERGTRDVKLSEALAIAGLLEFHLDSIGFTGEEEFRLREETEFRMMLRARKALLDAVRHVTRWVNNTDSETEDKMLEKRGLADYVELYTYGFSTSPAFQLGGHLGADGDNFAVYHDETDYAVKSAIVNAVTNRVLLSEAEFAEHHEEWRERVKDGPSVPLDHLFEPHAKY